MAELTLAINRDGEIFGYVDLDNMDELYDLETDPNEMENVIASPDYADVLEELKTELDALLE